MKPRDTKMGAKGGGLRGERAEKTAKEEDSIGGGKVRLEILKERNSSNTGGSDLETPRG
jgi:hypothetical protein